MKTNCCVHFPTEHNKNIFTELQLLQSFSIPFAQCHFPYTLVCILILHFIHVHGRFVSGAYVNQFNEFRFLLRIFFYIHHHRHNRHYYKQHFRHHYHLLLLLIFLFVLRLFLLNLPLLHYYLLLCLLVFLSLYCSFQRLINVDVIWNFIWTSSIRGTTSLIQLT